MARRLVRSAVVTVDGERVILDAGTEVDDPAVLDQLHPRMFGERPRGVAGVLRAQRPPEFQGVELDQLVGYAAGRGIALEPDATGEDVLKALTAADLELEGHIDVLAEHYETCPRAQDPDGTYDDSAPGSAALGAEPTPAATPDAPAPAPGTTSKARKGTTEAPHAQGSQA